jgi:chromosome partitioning protein
MKLLGLSVCLTRGHVWGASLQRPGWQTCRRCMMRRPDPWLSRPSEERAAAAPAPRGTGQLRTIVVAARKGGSGKTTLALHLAIAAHRRGRNAMLADADPQRSVSEAMKGRVGDGPRRLEAGPLGLEAVRTEADATGTEILVVDTPGGAGPALSDALGMADLALLVARPTFLDIAAAVRTFAEARAIGVPSLIVLNQAPPARAGQEHRAVAKAIEALRHTNLPVSEAIVRTRAVFQTSVASGRSVEELGPSLAADEIAAVWAVVEARLAEPRLEELVLRTAAPPGAVHEASPRSGAESRV